MVRLHLDLLIQIRNTIADLYKICNRKDVIFLHEGANGVVLDKVKKIPDLFSCPINCRLRQEGTICFDRFFEFPVDRKISKRSLISWKEMDRIPLIAQC